MLDGLWKDRQDRFWDRLGRLVARTGLTPDQVTWLSLLLVLANCAAYLWHRDPLVFGLLLGLLELGDNLDGALARVTGRCTRWGAYLDAVTDRYKELAAFGAVAQVSGHWGLCFACLGGALLTSYNKARAGMEVPIQNAPWPELFERFERLLLLVVGLALERFVPAPAPGWTALPIALLLIAVFSLLSSLQRMARARRVIREHEAGAS